VRTLSAAGGVGSGGFYIPGVASGRSGCGGGSAGMTLLWTGWLMSPAGALPGPGRLGFTLGMGLPVAA